MSPVPQSMAKTGQESAPGKYQLRLIPVQLQRKCQSWSCRCVLERHQPWCESLFCLRSASSSRTLSVLCSTLNGMADYCTSWRTQCVHTVCPLMSAPSCNLQSQILAAEGLDPCLRPLPEAPEFPPEVPTEETILCVPLAPSHGGTPATAALSLRRTTSSLAASFSRKGSRRCSAEDQHKDSFEAAVGHSLATAGPNDAPCATPEEEEYPDWWDKGPKELTETEFAPVRNSKSSLYSLLCLYNCVVVQ